MMGRNAEVEDLQRIRTVKVVRIIVEEAFYNFAE